MFDLFKNFKSTFTYSKKINIIRHEIDYLNLQPHEMKIVNIGFFRKKKIAVVLSCITGKIEQEFIGW